MANTEDRELEDILVKKEAPKRVEAKKEVVPKKAKLTSRTIASLKEKIREHRLDKAYAKYNKKYQKMKKAAIVASNAQALKAEGEDITDSELAVDYSIVASYDKKLAKMGAKLLKEDIKTIAASTDVSDKVVVGKRIKVPRFLLTKMRGLVATIEKIKTKKEQKKIAKEITKEITKETKEYIKSSLDGALFKEDGTLQEKIDAEVIRNLSLKGGKNATERRLDTLKGFISLDGKTSIFEKKDLDELEKEVATNTDLPPVEPTPTVAKEEEKVNVDKLLEAFGKKKEAPQLVKEAEKVAEVVEEKTQTTEVKETEEKNSVDARNKEINDILSKADMINKIRTTLRKTTDPTVRAGLEQRLASEKAEFDEMIKIEPKNKIAENEQTKSLEPISVEAKKTETPQPDGTKNTSPSVDVVEKTPIENVKVNKTQEIRASQVSSPSALRVTLQDIKKLEERNRNAQLQIAELRREKEELESQKKMLKEFIAKANITRDAEVQAKNMAESNATLKGEVVELNSQAAAIQSALGKTK